MTENQKIKKSPLRLLSLIPSGICIFLMFYELANKKTFEASIFLMLGLFGLLFSIPVITKMNMKTVPMFQILFTLIFGIILFSIAGFNDFIQAGNPPAQAFLFGVGAGVGVIILIMTITFD